MKVRQKSYKLCPEISGITTNFPKEKRCGLTSQTRIPAVFIPSNIAEGYERKHALEPLTPRILGPSSPVKLRRTIFVNSV
ncbi:MAG: four helix bundle protein [Deltaproteobacteria bacterium]|nr:four helix bundle protein [Deltaproteobacteria bacterium]